MVYITGAATTPIASAANGLLVTVNTALTGTITLTAATVAFAVITNPTVGSMYRYNGLRGKGAIAAVTSATCDVTISLLNRDI